MATHVSTFPEYLNQVKELVNQHLELVEEPLLLAIYYAPDGDVPERNPEDVFLFEVLGNFDGSSIAYEGDLLEVVYGNTPHFVMHSRDSLLHIILTSPAELYEAAQRNTRRFQEVKRALAEHRAQIIYSDPQGVELQKVLQ
jgi:hypothetical protein